VIELILWAAIGAAAGLIVGAWFAGWVFKNYSARR